MRRVGTKGRKTHLQSLYCVPVPFEALMTLRGPSQQAEDGLLTPGSCCCPPATVAGPAQGVLISGGTGQSERPFPRPCSGQPHNSQHGVGRGGLSPPPCSCWPPWLGTAFLLNEFSPQGCRTWGQAKTQLLGQGPLTRNLRTCPWLLLPGPQSCPQHGSWGQVSLHAQTVGHGSLTRTSRGEGCRVWVLGKSGMTGP